MTLNNQLVLCFWCDRTPMICLFFFISLHINTSTCDLTKYDTSALLTIQLITIKQLYIQLKVCAESPAYDISFCFNIWWSSMVHPPHRVFLWMFVSWAWRQKCLGMLFHTSPSSDAQLLSVMWEKQPDSPSFFCTSAKVQNWNAICSIKLI